MYLCEVFFATIWLLMSSNLNIWHSGHCCRCWSLNRMWMENERKSNVCVDEEGNNKWMVVNISINALLQTKVLTNSVHQMILEALAFSTLFDNFIITSYFSFHLFHFNFSSSFWLFPVLMLFRPVLFLLLTNFSCKYFPIYRPLQGGYKYIYVITVSSIYTWTLTIWILDAGCWMLVAKYKTQHFEFRI